jgi:hypothetical protein
MLKKMRRRCLLLREWEQSIDPVTRPAIVSMLGMGDRPFSEKKVAA